MEVDYEPRGPRPIKKLSKDVINQIAAAEIIHRPANAIKELIENSLDAGSTSIKLTLKDGGLKLIQISDNGHGISKADLPLLCERYATSKLTKFEDLASIGTYGFRGEALASISYVSHVEVVTKTRDDGCGWRAHYMDGELVPAKPGAGVDPKPAAANDGTIINAEDLFYNMPLRKRAFKSASDEYNRVLDVITKYAIHNPHCGWTCKKAGTSMAEITTSPASTSKANIALLYGSALASDLLELKSFTLKPEDKLGAKLKGWVSSANQSWARKGGWIIFINNRLVDSSKIKKAVESLYTTYLPKGASPWCYLSLEIDPAKVDVNVSPTKSEVHFLNEDEMIEAVVGAVQNVLAGSNTSRSFSVQTLLPGSSEPTQSRPDKRPEASQASTSTKPKAKAAPNYKVRMDPTNRTLDSMIQVTHPSQIGDIVESRSRGDGDERPTKRRHVTDDPLEIEEEDEDGEEDGDEEGVQAGSGMWVKKTIEVPESECDFTSIQELRGEVRKRENAEVKEIMLKHAFVGLVDLSYGLSLIQHSTRLFLANHTTLAEEHFYQLGLRQFGAFHHLRLDPPPLLSDLVRIGAEDEPGILSNGLDLDHVIDTITEILLDKREMLDEYFSTSLSPSGRLESLPLLLKGYTPDMDRVPHFLLCLGTRVDWTAEKDCFEGILRELAFFYAPRSSTPHLSIESNGKPGTDDEPEDKPGTIDKGKGKGKENPTHTHTHTLTREKDEVAGEEKEGGREGEEEKYKRWQLEHVLWPSMRRTAWTSSTLTNGDLKQIANLPDLFRIFERC